MAKKKIESYPESPTPSAEVRSPRTFMRPLFRRGSTAGASRNALRRLVQRLYLNIGDGAINYSVMLTCPSSAEATLAATLKLAEFLAENPNRRVLIVDTCLRERELSRRFDASVAPGFLDFLAGAQSSWTPLVRATPTDGVFILPAGHTEQDVNALLKPRQSRDALQAWLAEAKRDYNFVLLCAPSVLVSSYTLAFPSVVDCVLLLLEPGVTRREDAKACKETLESCNARDIGLVTALRGR